ncbi:hypothetical protein CAPTEDRAFT_211575 [Capitella teleta]|uniref:Uncharacterized protein n=1 Tax=Capitella teleta TaxID=283909 RepID=R7TNB4_CAPTE|nr:hypothetical protein CAPTEDRAFT_211575 [Capitella teleta]|eukprot:ELT95328.1 hypothetical protein CAPTEDRAFT_211575 [Capitella teleta]
MMEKMFNLQKVVEDWGWDRLHRRGNKKQKKMLKKQRTSSDASTEGPYIQMKIDWSRVTFVDKTTWGELLDEKSKEASSPGGRNQAEASVLFRTKFENDTKEPQEYTMRAQRTTKSTCNTEVERSYTREQELGITLKAPGDVFEANAGFKSEFTLSKVHGDSFEYELEWEVQSQIKVLGGNSAEACMEVLEEKKAGDFEVETKIYGKVIIRFFDVEKNKQILTTGDSIVSIVKEHLNMLRCTKEGKKKMGVLAFVEVKEDVEENSAPTTAEGEPQTAPDSDAKQNEGVKVEASQSEKTQNQGTNGAASRWSRLRKAFKGKSVEKEAGGSSNDAKKQEKVFITSRGSCRFRYGIEQDIKVKQDKIKKN